jgi:hypothetical protein
MTRPPARVVAPSWPAQCAGRGGRNPGAGELAIAGGRKAARELRSRPAPCVSPSPALRQPFTCPASASPFATGWEVAVGLGSGCGGGTSAGCQLVSCAFCVASTT